MAEHSTATFMRGVAAPAYRNDGAAWTMPETSMAPLFAALLVVWFPVQDLTAAFFHAHSIGVASYLSVVRNLLTCLFAGAAFVRARLSKQIRLTMSIYCLMVAVYSIVGLGAGAEPRVLIDSAGVLWLPVLTVLVGYYCHPNISTLRRSCWLLVLMGVLSTIFGFWEIHNTWFWNEVIQLGRYNVDVKGLEFGSVDGLPWNFFDYFGQRRAAGLLAAPLAEGSVTTIAAIVALALSRKSDIGLVGGIAIAGLCGIGVYQSGTRGAILMASLALVGYAFFSAHTSSRLVTNILIIAMTVIVAGGPLLTVLSYTVNLEDPSSLAHLASLLGNVMNIGSVAVFGDGVGMHGGFAAMMAKRVAAGGEGAIFSIAYQLGIPGALVFLWFYLSLLLQLRKGVKLGGMVGELSCAMGGLWIGALVTFPTSDHILTFSGMAGFWLLLGGTLRVIAETELRERRLAGYPDYQQVA